MVMRSVQYKDFHDSSQSISAVGSHLAWWYHVDSHVQIALVLPTVIPRIISLILKAILSIPPGCSSNGSSSWAKIGKVVILLRCFFVPLTVKICLKSYSALENFFSRLPVSFWNCFKISLEYFCKFPCSLILLMNTDFFSHKKLFFLSLCTHTNTHLFIWKKLKDKFNYTWVGLSWITKASINACYWK